MFSSIRVCTAVYSSLSFNSIQLQRIAAENRSISEFAFRTLAWVAACCCWCFYCTYFFLLFRTWPQRWLSFFFVYRMNIHSHTATNKQSAMQFCSNAQPNIYLSLTQNLWQQWWFVIQCTCCLLFCLVACAQNICFHGLATLSHGWLSLTRYNHNFRKFCPANLLSLGGTRAL